jgi:hypothetical protein
MGKSSVPLPDPLVNEIDVGFELTIDLKIEIENVGVMNGLYYWEEIEIALIAISTVIAMNRCLVGKIEIEIELSMVEIVLRMNACRTIGS